MRWAIVVSGDQERRRDLGDGEPAEQPQGECHPGLGRQRRMAAGEDQPEPVVLDGAGRLVGRVVVDHQGRLVLGVALLFAADPVHGPAARGGGQPAARVGRHPVDRPASRGRPGAPRRRPPRRRRGRRSGAPARRPPGRTPRGRSARSPRLTSPRHRPVTRPGTAAPRPCRGRPPRPPSPTRSAASRSGAWITQKPPRYSLDSAYGPSVTIGVSPVAVDGGGLRRSASGRRRTPRRPRRGPSG